MVWWGGVRKHKRLDWLDWDKIREEVYERDGGKCAHCGEEVELNKCHIDHIVPLSRGGANDLSNLRTLCPKCHVLRVDKSHRGMISTALKREWIPPNWRDMVW